jgi:dTDP-4-dehydrorhamnose reductase
MRICITGSEGMLGFDLAKRLRRKYEVIGVDIDDFDIVHDNFADFLLKNKPDFLFHLAAYTNVDGAEEEKRNAYDVNVLGTRNVVTACRVLDIPLVFLSTDYVFDGRKKGSYEVYDEANPINFYGVTKREAEKIVTNTLRKFFLVRTSWLFGSNGKNFVKTILSLSRERESIDVVDDQRGSPTYTKDLALSLEYFIPSERYGVYHITNSGVCTWYDFAKTILSFIGSNTIVNPVKSESFPRPAKRPRNSVLKNKEFEEIFGHTMPSWNNAVRRYLTAEGVLGEQ